MNMRFKRFNFVFVIGLVMIVGLATVFAAGHDDKKQPKNTGILTIRTAEKSYPVKIDGVERGQTGVVDPAVFYLAPGFHTITVTGPKGAVFTKEVEIRLNHRVCLCLRVDEKTTSRPCPYNFRLEGPDKISEGDDLIFSAISSAVSPVPLRYAWKVTPDTLRIKSGLGTPSITIDTHGMGGNTISADLDVNDEVYDNKCRQVIPISVPVDKVEIVLPKAYVCSEFEAKNRDQDKARFDDCAIQVQNTPNSRFYVFIYPGTDKLSTTRITFDQASKYMRDYLVTKIHLDAGRIDIFKANTTRTRTTFKIWVVPAGAKLPVE
jgi:hypothetical protein